MSSIINIPESPSSSKCGICLEYESSGQSLLEHNKHFFHSTCLEKWRKISNSSHCPTCRTELPIELPWSRAGYQIESRSYTLEILENRVVVQVDSNSNNSNGMDWKFLLCCLGIYSVIFTVMVLSNPSVNSDNGGGWG